MVAQMDFGKTLGITANVICTRLDTAGYFFIKDAGFQCVDFNLQRGFFDPDSLRFRTDIEKIVLNHKSAIENAGLKISQTHAPYYFLDKHIKNPTDFERYLQCVMESIDITAELGTKYLVLHPFFLTSGLEELQTTQTAFNLKYLAYLTEYAQRKNISVALENLPYDFCGNASSHRHLIETLGHPNVSACFDTGHSLIIEGKHAPNHAADMSDLIRVVHLHDNDGRRDIHWHIDPEKNVWLKIMAVLLANKNLATLSLETSGVYKTCRAEDIPSELREDFRLITKILHEAKKKSHDTF